MPFKKQYLFPLIGIALLSAACKNSPTSKTVMPVYTIAENRDAKALSDLEPFRMIDQNSEAHALSNYADKESLFLVKVQKDCPLALTDVIQKSANPDPQRHAVLGVSSNLDLTHQDFQNSKLPILFDDLDFLRRHYGVTAPGEYIELSPATGQVISKGAMSVAPSEACKNKEPEKEQKWESDFKTTVLPAFSKQCISCHIRYSDIDYLTDFKSIINYKKMILKTMETMRMPLGGYDNRVTYPLAAYVSRYELRGIYDWVASIKNYSEEQDHLLKAARKRIQEQWSEYAKRTPDIVLKQEKPNTIPPSGPDFYINETLYGPLKEDTYFEAAFFQHNLGVLHHSNLYATPEPIEGSTPIEGNHMFALPTIFHEKVGASVWIDGQKGEDNSRIEYALFSISRTTGWTINYPGTAYFAKKGSYIALNSHYHPNGTPETNASQIELYKYTGKDKPKIIKVMYVSPKSFLIPAHERDFNIEVSIPIKKNIHLVAAPPHMHYRGKSFKMDVMRPGSKNWDLLLSQPYHQLNLERIPIYKDPVAVPKGSTLRLRTRYDNSKFNASNPDPEMKVKLGRGVYKNEMHSMRIYYFED